MSVSPPIFLPHPHQRIYPIEPSWLGTFALLLGIVLSFSLFDEPSPSLMARGVAITVGISLGISILFDSKRGLRNLFRTDLICLLALYFLTLVEFLFPQPRFDTLLTMEQTIKALEVVLFGMGSMAIGRHLVSSKNRQPRWMQFGEISNKLLFRVFMIAALLGFLYMLISVQFNIILMIGFMMERRFIQPWTRGRYGDWRALISELNLLLYLVPPLMGVIWNRRQSFGGWRVGMAIAIFTLTLFHAFAGGTRNVFVAHIATFLGGYLLTLKRHTFRNTILPVFLAFCLVFFSSYHMLEFRTMGLRSYLEGEVYASESTRDTFSVDYNLYVIGVLTDVFPQQVDYLGFEIFAWSLARPIPRALWPGKPLGLSVGIEEAVGISGYTLSSTYLGESYMSGGLLAVIVVSLLIGALASWWNNVAIQRWSSYAMVVYAVGFFAAAISMRSMITFTTAILPVVALIVFRKIVIPFFNSSPR